MTLVTVDDVLRGLASLPGRKLCLLVSDGFLVGKGTSEERTGLLRQVIDAATRSGAVVYALDARGLTPGGPTPASPARRWTRACASASRSWRRRSRARRFSAWPATRAGSSCATRTSSAPGLGRMLADNDAFYLIAYEPTNAKRDGRFRKIELRLPRHPDLAVRTRAGYLAPDDRKRAPRRRRGPGRAAVARGRPGGARRGRGPGGPGGARSPERRARARDRRLPRPPAGGAPGDRPGARGRGRAAVAADRTVAARPTSRCSAASTTPTATPSGCRSGGASRWTWGRPSYGGPPRRGSSTRTGCPWARAATRSGSSPASRPSRPSAARASGWRCPTSARRS